jgi:hypothetical protein
MSTAKHTPGPWYFSKHEELGSTRFYIAQADGAEYTPNYSDVAFTTCNGEYVDIQEANARLIAAAPELLEALQRVTEWRATLAATPGLSAKSSIIEDFDDALAAIAKAV